MVLKAVVRAGQSTMYVATMGDVQIFQPMYLGWRIAGWSRLADGSMQVELVVSCWDVCGPCTCGVRCCVCVLGGEYMREWYEWCDCG